MKFSKIMIAIVFTLGLLVAQSGVLASFSLSRAVEPTAMRENIKQSGLLDSITDSISSSITSDALVAQYVNRLLSTKAVSDTLTDYTADQATAMLKGEEAEGFTKEELSSVMSEGMDTLSVSDYVKKSVTDFINENGDETTQYINQAIPTPEMTEEYGYVLSITKLLLVPLNKIILAALTIILGVLLIVTLWRNKAGFLIWGIICVVLGAGFLLTGQIGLSAVTETWSNDQMLSNGFDVFTPAITFTGGVSAAAGVIALVLYIILRRRRNNG